MGKTESIDLNLLIKEEKEIDKFNHLNENEFLLYCVEESEKIVKDLKIKEIQTSFTEFGKILSKTVYDLKKAIYIVEDSNASKSPLFLKVLNTLRDKIDNEFRHNHSSIINWHKPSSFEKLFMNGLKNNINPLTGSEPFKLIDLKPIYKPTKITKTPDWHFVFIEIIKGNIRIEKVDNYTSKHFYNENEFKNATKLGNHIAKLLNKKAVV
jgi:hypothetical protein